MSLFSSIPPGLSDSHWLAEVNTRIKQLLKQRGEDSATRLFGEAWLDYLCSRYPSARRSALRPLAADLYRPQVQLGEEKRDRKSTRLNSSHVRISYAVFCLKKKNASIRQ